MIIEPSRGKKHLDLIIGTQATEDPGVYIQNLGLFVECAKGILTCFLFHRGAASKIKSVNTSAISDYLILEAGISFQFIGNSVKCIHLWGGMFYLMGSLIMALPCWLGCGQVEKIQETYVLWGPLSGHMLRGSIPVCRAQGILLKLWVFVVGKERKLVAQSWLTLCDPMDCSLSGSSVHGILQARVLEWVAISFSREMFLIQKLNPDLLHCRQIHYHLSHQGSLWWAKELEIIQPITQAPLDEVTDLERRHVTCILLQLLIVTKSCPALGPHQLLCLPRSRPHFTLMEKEHENSVFLTPSPVCLYFILMHWSSGP